MNKYINTTILLLIGAYIGFNIFFSFIVAPLLFSHFNHRLAGEITNLIFPYYFASGWVIGIIVYTLIAVKSIKERDVIKELKGFLIGLVFLVIFSMVLDKTILKIGQEANAQYYQLLDEGKKDEAQKIKSKFKTVHTVSTVINFSNLLIAIYLFVYFCLYTQNARKREKNI